MSKTRQRKLDRVKGKVLIVGVDVGRFKHDAALRLPGGEVVRRIQVGNDRAGFERLAGECERARGEHGLERVVVGMEPTGHYWEALAHWWEDRYEAVVLVNPMHTRRARELEDNSPLKTDRKDGGLIADLVAGGKYLESHLPRGVFAQLRNLVGQRERIQKERTTLINQLHQGVDRLFPELVKAFCSLTAKSCLQLLKISPQPTEVAEVGLEELSEWLRQWSQGQLGEAKARRLQQLARESVGVREAAGTIAREVKRVVGRLELLERERGELEWEIQQRLAEAPGAKLLLTVPGFGPITVATLLANTGDLRDYRHAEEAIKLAGLNLFEVSSGEHKGQCRISKRGRAQLRRILYLAALRAAQDRGPFQEYYQRLLGAGVVRMKAVVALMRKLLRVSWSMIRHGETFEPARLTQSQAFRPAA